MYICVSHQDSSEHKLAVTLPNLNLIFAKANLRSDVVVQLCQLNTCINKAMSVRR